MRRKRKRLYHAKTSKSTGSRIFLAPGAHIRLIWRDISQVEAGADELHNLAISYYATSGVLGFRNKYRPYRGNFVIDTGYVYPNQRRAP